MSMYDHITYGTATKNSLNQNFDNAEKKHIKAILLTTSSQHHR